MFKYILIGLKKDFVWVILDIEEIRDKDNETGLKRGKKNRNVKSTVVSIYAMLALFALNTYLETVQCK